MCIWCWLLPPYALRFATLFSIAHAAPRMHSHISTRPSCDCNCCREKRCQQHECKHLYTIVCHTVCVRQLLPLLHAPKLTAIDPPVLIRAAKRHCSRNKVYIQRLHFSSFLFFLPFHFMLTFFPMLCFAFWMAQSA